MLFMFKNAMIFKLVDISIKKKLTLNTIILLITIKRWIKKKKLFVF